MDATNMREWGVIGVLALALTSACTGVDFWAPHPSVRAVDPANGHTFVARDTSVNVDLNLPNVGKGVDARTLTPSNVRLTRTWDGLPVETTVNTSGGGDAIVLQPRALLDARTGYDFILNGGVTDQAGVSFVPFQSHFTTGDFTNISIDQRYHYDVDPVPLYNGSPISSLLVGPDGRLYATALDGMVRRWTIGPDGRLGPAEEFAGLQGRALIGIAFDPVASNTIWVTTNAPVYLQPAPDFTGTITKITIDPTQPGFVARAEDVVIGLPRSAKDHMTNSVSFGPDGALYVVQGSMTAAGAPDSTWYNRHEHLLSSAVLRVDLTLLANVTGPLNVATENPDGTPMATPYDPAAPGAPVTLFGTGLRNAYDLVWHSNGHLYCPTNGTAAGGNTPQSPPGVMPMVPGLVSIPTQDDFLFDVVAGGYYGHPNPTRGEYVLNGGNPTAGVDPDEVAESEKGVGYPVGTYPDRSWKGSVFNFSRNRSPDGALEVRSNVFEGGIRGYLLVVEYSAGDDILAIPIPPGGGPIDRRGVVQVAAGLSNPVDVAEHVTTGNLYVAQLVLGGLDGGAIVLLRPDGGT